jgi:predicted CXXCH cytochrome family protein
VQRAPAILLLILGGAGLLAAQTRHVSAILNSKHDFRATSSAGIRSTTGQDTCIFCHTPHNANPEPLLWNHRVSSAQFPSYTSSTLQATISPLTGRDTSKLCLSCHDGTIALGNTENNGLIPFIQGSGYTLPVSSPSNLAGNRGFTDDHPFAFTPVLGPEIRRPASGDAVRLDASGRAQCTSCHEPHQENIDPTARKFLVKPNPSSAICLTCHTTEGWMNSWHRLPPDPSEDLRYTAQQGAHTGYIGVSQNGCESCHRPHSAQTAQRLVKLTLTNTCYQCHDGSVTSLNIKAEFLTKTYLHPVNLTTSVHDASESPSSPQFPLPETSAGAPRHSECVDCHSPHFSSGTPAQPPQVSGALAGATGQSAAGTFVPRSGNEYEICFKCHADSANKPQMFDTSTVGIGYGRNPQRQFDVGNPNRYNTRIEFQFSFSFHPVTRAANLSTGPGGDDPSLRLQPISPGGVPLPNRTLAPSSLIYCSDCHANDTGRNIPGFTGPEGPHGSNIPHLLERANQLEMPPGIPGGSSPGISYSPANSALCDKCHDVTGSVLQNQSFSAHGMHVRGENTACSTCHAPHGSLAPMLVNFDLSIVGPSSSGRLEYRRTGFRQGLCYLRCHGEDHNPEHYGPGGN